ncbi:DUF4214 domain-containing protein, partial [Escherichia coli]|uniref:DUF4214 domain-containing protein n=2 Tax=Enterobacteriaceae TaxID=543 RepID=UPI0013D27728
GRAPDAAGIETWSRALANGATVGQIAEGFLASGEYTSLHGPAVAESNAGFVAELYAVVLGRPGDAAGTSHWL